MNFAHVHLVINHIPLIGIPVALLFLAHGLWTKNAATQRFSLLVLFSLAAIVVPVYLTGEPAEEVVEHLPGVAESFIEAHEEAAKFSLILTLTTGALAAISLWFQKHPSRGRLLNFGVLGVATVALLSLAYTANLGGKIRHTELRSNGTALSNDLNSQRSGEGKAEGNDDDDDK